MVGEYVETEKSKWARGKLEKALELAISSGEVSPTSPEADILRAVIKYITLNTVIMFPFNKELRTRRAVDILHISNSPDYHLLKLIPEMNLSGEDVKEVIEKFVSSKWNTPYAGFDKSKKEAWNKSGREIGKKSYLGLCKYLEITPNSNFPNW